MTTETNIANTAAADTIESNDATDTIPESPMRILKVGTASSFSNRSTFGGVNKLTCQVEMADFCEIT